jgi:EmrB/QacA subfamily drug resistance transporter
MSSVTQTSNPKPQTSGKGIWVLAATILGSSMVFIDGTVVNVALPVLQKDLNADATQVQWVVEAYSLFLAALILVGGSLGDLFGRKRIYIIGVGLFTAASSWCGFAPDIYQLIIARAVQGIGGALLTPGSLAIISAYFDAKERGTAIGTWSSFTSITAILGPLLGGFLVQYASWRFVFFINLPLAVLVLFLTTRHVPESRDSADKARLDLPGALFATLGLGALTYGLIQAGAAGLTDAVVLTALGTGLAALVVFVIIEARTATPMMPLSLFRSHTFAGANLLTLLLYGALGGALYFLPFNLIQVQGFSPSAAGAAILPGILVLAVLSRWAGGLIPRVGAKLPLIIGPSIAGLGFFLFGALPGVGSNYWTTFFPASLTFGLGMAIAVAPLTTAVMGAVPPQRSGIASGVNNAVSRAAGLLAIAVLGLFVLSTFSASLDHHLDQLNVSPAVRQQLDDQRIKLAAIKLPVGLSDTDTKAIQQAINESFVDGFRLAMFIAAGLALASALCALLLIEGKPPKQMVNDEC